MPSPTELRQPLTLSDKRPGCDRDADIDERVSALIRRNDAGRKNRSIAASQWRWGRCHRHRRSSLRPGIRFTSLIRKGQVGSILNEVDATQSMHCKSWPSRKAASACRSSSGATSFTAFARSFQFRSAQAASWNPELVEQAAAVAAREARSVGIHWTFAPMVDIARDPRWGRIAESLGEDPAPGERAVRRHGAWFSRR